MRWTKSSGWDQALKRHMWRILNAHLCWFVSNHDADRQQEHQKGGRSRWTSFSCLPERIPSNSWMTPDTLRQLPLSHITFHHTAVRLVLREAWTSQRMSRESAATCPFSPLCLILCLLPPVNEHVTRCHKWGRVRESGKRGTGRDSSVSEGRGEREARSGSSVGTSDSCVKHQKFFYPRLRRHKGKGAAAAEAAVAVIIIIILTTTWTLLLLLFSRVASHPANET